LKRDNLKKMVRLKRSPDGYWNETKCREVAKTCNSIEEFREAFEGRAYINSRKRGQVKSLTREMYDEGYWPLPEKMAKGYWTLEKCKEVCENYDSQADLLLEHPKVYRAVKDHGWQQECFAQMKGKKNPQGFWTLEKCKEEASKYDSPADMMRGNPKAYTAMKYHGWYEECCSEMKGRRVPNNFWNEERIVDVMLTTDSRTMFQSDYPGAYKAANELGIYERLTKVMVKQELWKDKNTKRKKKAKPDQKWSDELAIERASGYESLYEFRTKDPTAYHALLVRGLLETACSHMERRHMPEGYWNKERVMEKVAASESLKDFKKRFNAAYQAALTNGWLADVVAVLGHEREQWTIEKAKKVIATCTDYHDFRTHYRGCWNYLCERNMLEKLTSHLERKGDLYHRRIYVFEFKDGHAYVGLAKDPDDRYKKHTIYDKTSAVYQYLQQTSCKFDFKLLTGWLDKDEASKEEERWRQKYIEDGWKMLNRVKCGSLGGWHGELYSLEECQQEGSKYRTRKEFYRKNQAIYTYSKKHYGLDVVCPHMEKDAKVKWPIERIEQELKKYGTMPEIKEENRSLFCAIRNKKLEKKYFMMINSILVIREEFMSEEVRHRFIRDYGSVLNYKKHSLLDCQKVAMKYKTRGEFKEKDKGMYTYSRKNYDMDIVCKHMETKNAACKWDEEKVATEIGRYDTMAQIRKENPSLYSRIMSQHLQETFFNRIQPIKGKYYFVVKPEYRKK
jgi:predicted GIY-YIG superfamily endonuclease